GDHGKAVDRPTRRHALHRLQDRGGAARAPQPQLLNGGAVTARVRTAVIPVAGLGTRFLPVTKAVPKEMLPIVDRPCIEYVVAEAVQAAITELLFGTARGKG